MPQTVPDGGRVASSNSRQSSMEVENYCYCHLGRLNGKVMINKICVLGNRKKGAQINDNIVSLLITFQ